MVSYFIYLVVWCYGASHDLYTCRLGMRSLVSVLYLKTKSSLMFCNDLFSRFEQYILFLEKQAEATDPTTDRHGHDGPSQGLVSKHLENLKLGTENRLSELRNEMARRTVTALTDSYRL